MLAFLNDFLQQWGMCIQYSMHKNKMASRYRLYNPQPDLLKFQQLYPEMNIQ